MSSKCIICDKEVPRERVEALSEMNKETTCIQCSEKFTPQKMGLTIFSHKTAPDVFIFNKGGEAERIARAVYSRKR